MPNFQKTYLLVLATIAKYKWEGLSPGFSYLLSYHTVLEVNVSGQFVDILMSEWSSQVSFVTLDDGMLIHHRHLNRFT